MISFASSQAPPNHWVRTKIVPKCRPACAHQSAWRSVRTYIYNLLFCTYWSAQTHLLCKTELSTSRRCRNMACIHWDPSSGVVNIQFSGALCSLCPQAGSLTFDQGYCAIIVGIIYFCLFHILSIVTRASVGFLAVPGLDSVTRIITLLSVVFTLGSIMTSVYLLWRHQSGGERLEYNVRPLQFTLVGWLSQFPLDLTSRNRVSGGCSSHCPQHPICIPCVGRYNVPCGGHIIFLSWIPTYPGWW